MIVGSIISEVSPLSITADLKNVYSNLVRFVFVHIYIHTINVLITLLN
jgi:hypothetical protein